MLDWNDLRYFLAVADHGSTLAAGRVLRVSQTTVARRIAALEQALGHPLFDRRQAGYVLTPDGEALIDRARRVETAAGEFADASAALARQTSGTVCITTQEIFANTLLAPILRDLHNCYPDIIIEMNTHMELLDLGDGRADIALRSTADSPSAGTVGRRLCVDDWTLYCSRGYAELHGLPRTRDDLRDHAIIGGGGGKLWLHYEAWLRKLGLEDRVAMHQASSTGLLFGVRSGFGLGVLPCLVADADPDLLRCLPPRSDHHREIWLLTHERVRRTPRVRLVIDFLYERLMHHVRMLEDARAVA